MSTPKITSDPLKINVPDAIRWPAYRIGETQDTMPHVITWHDYTSTPDRDRQGQVWSRAAKDSQWDSVAYWAIPFDAPGTVVKVVGHSNRDLLTQVPEWHYRTA